MTALRTRTASDSAAAQETMMKLALAWFALLAGLSGAAGAQSLVYGVTLPLEQLFGRACAALPFSVAELLYVLAALTAVVQR